MLRVEILFLDVRSLPQVWRPPLSQWLHCVPSSLHLPMLPLCTSYRCCRRGVAHHYQLWKRAMSLQWADHGSWSCCCSKKDCRVCQPGWRCSCAIPLPHQRPQRDAQRRKGICASHRQAHCPHWKDLIPSFLFLLCFPFPVILSTVLQPNPLLLQSLLLFQHPPPL